MYTLLITVSYIGWLSLSSGFSSGPFGDSLNGSFTIQLKKF